MVVRALPEIFSQVAIEMVPSNLTPSFAGTRKLVTLSALVGTALIFAEFAGCNKSAATVSGIVTLDSKPVEGSSDLYATVTFVREDGGGAPAIGIISGSGRYALSTGSAKGLEPGKYRVGVSVKKILPPATPEGLPIPKRISRAKDAKPEESGLEATVKPGTNTFDFAVSSATNK